MSVAWQCDGTDEGNGGRLRAWRRWNVKSHNNQVRITGEAKRSSVIRIGDRGSGTIPQIEMAQQVTYGIRSALGEPAKNPRKKPRKEPPRERALSGGWRGVGGSCKRAAMEPLISKLRAKCPARPTTEQHRANPVTHLLPLSDCQQKRTQGDLL